MSNRHSWIFTGSWRPWTTADSFGLWHTQNTGCVVNTKQVLVLMQVCTPIRGANNFLLKPPSTLKLILPHLRVDMCGDFCNGIGFYVMLTEVFPHLLQIIWYKPLLLFGNLSAFPRRLLFSRLCYPLARTQIPWVTFVQYLSLAGAISINDNLILIAPVGADYDEVLLLL